MLHRSSRAAGHPVASSMLTCIHFTVSQCVRVNNTAWDHCLQGTVLLLLLQCCTCQDQGFIRLAVTHVS
jgi:hypothetical protein